MKRVVLRFRKVDLDKFNAIADGTKKVETRAATKKFDSCVAGDVLVLICGSERKEKKIKKVTHFGSLKKLFAVYDVEDVLPAAKSAQEAYDIYYSFPGYKDKIAKHGIMAFELK